MSTKKSQAIAESMTDMIFIISNRLAKEGHQLRRMYREKPDFEEDSGWRLLAGTETQKYLDKDENLEIWTLAEVVEKYESISEYLLLPTGTDLSFDEDGALEKSEDLE